MIPALLQWLVYATLGGLFWLAGNQALHIRDFGWFAGLMLLAVAGVVAAVIALERRKEGEETDGSR